MRSPYSLVVAQNCGILKTLIRPYDVTLINAAYAKWLSGSNGLV